MVAGNPGFHRIRRETVRTTVAVAPVHVDEQHDALVWKQTLEPTLGADDVTKLVYDIEVVVTSHTARHVRHEDDHTHALELEAGVNLHQLDKVQPDQTTDHREQSTEQTYQPPVPSLLGDVGDEVRQHTVQRPRWRSRPQ